MSHQGILLEQQKADSTLGVVINRIGLMVSVENASSLDVIGLYQNHHIDKLEKVWLPNGTSWCVYIIATCASLF